MQKQDISISALVEMYKRGELRLPEIQRHYVWRSTRVRDLLDSLYRGYPSGSILMWETDEAVPTKDFAIAQDSTAFAGRKLLLDGQQRLTSLTAVMNGEMVKVRGRKKPIDILFNLDHPDGPPTEITEVEEDDGAQIQDDDEISDDDDETEGGNHELAERFANRTFIVSSRALAALPNWVSVSKVFKSADNTEFLSKAGITAITHPRCTKYTERLTKLRQIKDYLYVVHVLERSMSYEEVTEIFVRVNSLGAKLRSSDLALAQITSKWRNLLSLFEEFQEECEKSWFTLDFGLLVRCLVVQATQQALFRSVGTIPLERLKKGWEEAKDGLRFAINFLRSNLDIEDESLLSSPFFIVTLAAISRVKNDKLTLEEERTLRYWLLVANAKGRYSRGASESLLNEDLAVVFRKQPLTALVDTLKRQFGRLEVEPGDMMNRGANSPLFSLAFLALKQHGANDWFNGMGLSLTNQGRLHFIQWHHIFPKSLLKEGGYETGEINEIANMAFITGQTNRRISNKKPEEYLPKIIDARSEAALESQLVPVDPSQWRIEAYREFLAKRRERLVALMNEFIRSKSGKTR